MDNCKPLLRGDVAPANNGKHRAGSHRVVRAATDGGGAGGGGGGAGPGAGGGGGGVAAWSTASMG